MRLFIFRMKALLLVLLLLTTSLPVSARLFRRWSYQEMLDKSDIVVIARPIAATKNTKEDTVLQNMQGVRVIGVESDFEILAVLKGSKDEKKLTLHHYHLSKPEDPINGPNLFYLDSQRYHTFLLFLI